MRKMVSESGSLFVKSKYSADEKLINFFNAENNRDWKLYESFLSRDIELISYDPPSEKPWLEGRRMSRL